MARRNPGIRGWRRVIGGNPCSFCAMLASRGGVYGATTVDFPAHDHCSCTQEPVYAGEADPPEVQALRDEWERVTRGLSGEDAIAEWHRHWGDVASGVRPRVGTAPRPSFADRAAAARQGEAALSSPRVSLRRPPDDVLEHAQTREQIEALRQYKGVAYTPVNDALRLQRGAPDRLRAVYPQIDDIDTAMARSRLPADVLVHRGVQDPRAVFGPAWDRNLAGAQWTEHAYLSTTTDPRIAAQFARDDGVVMRIMAPRGTGGVELSGPAYESELLLERALTLRVVADSGPGSVPRRIDVEVLR